MDRLNPAPPPRRYRLIGADGIVVASDVPGTLGGTRRGLYGRLDCPSARRALARPVETYSAGRVFFADEATAAAAGFRPCAVCLPEAYRAWRAGHPRGVRAGVRKVAFTA